MSENNEFSLEGILFLITRIMLSGIFLWSALTKTFGLGFGTEAGKQWLAGNSPTFGFLKFGTSGSFAHDFFLLLAGESGIWMVDFLFMLGLWGIGISLLLGIFRKIAGYGGALLMILMWLGSATWAATDSHNPFFDDHLVYGAFLLLVAHATNIGWRLNLNLSDISPLLD